MHDDRLHLTRLYLPLLSHEQQDVRQHACDLFLSAYGTRALSYLRRMLKDPSIQTQQRARTALQSIADEFQLDIRPQPFAGMHVETLGRLAVYIDNYEIQMQDWAEAGGGHAGLHKVQGIFAYLVHCGRRGASRSAIVEAVWGRTANGASLSRTLTALRKLFEQIGGEEFTERALVITNDHCMLNPDLYTSDMQLFEQTFDAAYQCEQVSTLSRAIPLYDQALQLYGGPYMADVPRSSAWCMARRDQLMNNFIITVERLAEHAFEHRRYQQCIAYCQQALDADLTDDSIVSWLLRSYAALGLRAELEHAYRRYLRVAGLELSAADAYQDAVTTTYHQLKAS